MSSIKSLIEDLAPEGEEINPEEVLITLTNAYNSSPLLYWMINNLTAPYQWRTRSTWRNSRTWKCSLSATPL